MVGKSTISALFGHSPVRPLQEHISLVTECASQVPPLIAAVCAGDSTAIKTHAERVFELESAADEVKNELRAHLPKSLFMPVDRRDLLEILDLQDEIADKSEDIAGLLVEREMPFPSVLHVDVKSLAQRSADACAQASKIIHELDELLATGFGGRRSELVFEMVDELSKIESDTDRLARGLMRGLHPFEDEMGAVSVLLWRQLISNLSGLADDAEKIGNRLRLIMAR